VRNIARSDLKAQPCGELECAGPAATEDGVTPVSGLREVRVEQVPGIAAQIRDVEDVEPFRDQPQPEVFLDLPALRTHKRLFPS